MTVCIGIHFLREYQLFKWIGPLYLSLMSLGIFCTVVTLYKINKRQKKEGFVPLLLYQISAILFVVFFPVIFWDLMGLFKGTFCGSAFVYTIAAVTLMGILGIFHSKIWFLGGVVLFIGMLLAFFIRDYAFIILGVAYGTGNIIPAIMVDLNYRRQEKENAQA